MGLAPMRSRTLVTLAAAAAGIAGCAGGGSRMLPASTLPAVRAGAISWMDRRATAQDLLYVSDVGTDSVYVYSYPQAALVGTLSGFDSPVRVCSDPHGYVYVTNTYSSQILKYRHGGTRPIKTLSDPNFLPVDCAVDPTSGTLAVTNYGPSYPNTGSVALYRDGAGPAKIYRDPTVQGYLFCAYDGNGDLFVNGLNYSYDQVFIELRKAATKFTAIELDRQFAGWGGVGWDGRYVAVGDGISKIVDFAVKGHAGRSVRTIELRRAVNVVQFAMDGATLVAPDGPNGAHHNAAFWSYPGGGSPTKTIGNGLFKNPSGAAISLAP